MTDEKQKTDWKTPLIVVVAVVVVAIIVLAVIPKKVELEPLTDEDLKIVNAFWNTYQTKYDYKLNTYVPDETLSPINWTYYCDDKNLDCWGDGQPCKLGNYQFTTQQREDLLCNYWYNGLKESVNGEGWIFENGTKTYGLGGRGLDIRQNNEIMICCVSDRGDKTGEICDSVTLGAKC